MIRPTRLALAFGVGALLAIGGVPARAADAGAQSKTVAATDAGAPGRAAPDPHSGAGMNPHGGGASPHGGGNPHGGGEARDPEAPPEDTSEIDATVPPNTVVVELFDQDRKPLPKTIVTVGVVKNTVAKGESREKIVRTTDDQGIVRLENLERATGVAYRVTSGRDGATYAAPPFNLPEKAGIRVKLHVYPVTEDIDQAMVLSQSIAVIELEDDQIQVSQQFQIFNVGKKAWLANKIIKFPAGFAGFAAQQAMSDVGADAVEKVGIKLRGTVGPGQHEIEFRWHVPYSGDKSAAIDIPLPPHALGARIIVPAAGQMKVNVADFPEPKMRTGEKGQRAAVTEKQFDRQSLPPEVVRVSLLELPGGGVGKYFVTTFAAAAGLVGLVVLVTRRRENDEAGALARRTRLLEELGELEEARARGDVGPKTYERERRDIVDRIAATFA